MGPGALFTYLSQGHQPRRASPTYSLGPPVWQSRCPCCDGPRPGYRLLPGRFALSGELLTALEELRHLGRPVDTDLLGAILWRVREEAAEIAAAPALVQFLFCLQVAKELPGVLQDLGVPCARQLLKAAAAEGTARAGCQSPPSR